MDFVNILTRPWPANIFVKDSPQFFSWPGYYLIQDSNMQLCLFACLLVCMLAALAQLTGKMHPMYIIPKEQYKGRNDAHVIF